MEILLSVVYIVVFLVFIRHNRFFQVANLSVNVLSFFFLLKVCAGVLLYFTYTYYYADRSTADIFKYFDDSEIMYRAVREHPADYVRMLTGIANDSQYFNDQYYNQMNNWYRQFETSTYNDNHTVIRFNAFVRLFSFGYYQVHSIWLNFISFTGLVALYKLFTKYMPQIKYSLAMAVFLLPSLLFWGSGVLKEGFVLFGVGMLLYQFDNLIDQPKRLTGYAGFLLALVVLRYTKVYVLLALLPLMVSYGWTKLTSRRFAWLKYAAPLVLGILVVLNIHHVLPEFNIVEAIARKRHDFINLASFMEAGSLISRQELKPTAWSLLTEAPNAFCITLFRPFFFEMQSPLYVISGLENLLFLVMLAIACWHHNTNNIQINLFLLSVSFVVITFVLTGLVTPVLGAIVRYKVPALPFLVLVSVMFIDEQRLAGKIHKKLKFTIKR